jgi:hypothetical protein
LETEREANYYNPVTRSATHNVKSLVFFNYNSQPSARHVILNGAPLCGKTYKTSIPEVVKEPPNCPKCRHYIEWRLWDWTKNNAQLARQYRMTRENVRIIRRTINAPQSPDYRKRTLGTALRAAMALPNKIWRTESNTALAKRFGVTVKYVSQVRHQLNKPPGPDR